MSHNYNYGAVLEFNCPSSKYFHVFSKNKTCCNLLIAHASRLLLAVVQQYDEPLPSRAKKCISTQGLSILT